MGRAEAGIRGEGRGLRLVGRLPVYIIERGRAASSRSTPAGSPSTGEPTAERRRIDGEVRSRRRRWADCRDDDLTFGLSFETLKVESPRILYIAFGDTDEHGHGGRYDLLLDAAHDFLMPT